MRESSKTKKVRDPYFEDVYFSGSVLDIGCGDDLVVPSAKAFDIEEGDANRILDYLESNSFDTVHSSHCLEHMNDPMKALADWWELVKPNGYLITVVPDEDLYEQGVWPSRFNGDHKSTFTMKEGASWSPVSHDVLKIHSELPGAHIVDICQQSDGYDFNLPSGVDQTTGDALAQIQVIVQKWR